MNTSRSPGEAVESLWSAGVLESRRKYEVTWENGRQFQISLKSMLPSIYAFPSVQITQKNIQEAPGAKERTVPGSNRPYWLEISQILIEDQGATTTPTIRYTVLWHVNFQTFRRALDTSPQVPLG